MKATDQDGIGMRLLSHPRALLWAIVVVTLAAASLVPLIKIENGINSWRDLDHPRQQMLRQLEQRFATDSWAFIAYETDDIFSAAALSKIRDLSQQIRKLQVQQDDGTSFKLIEDVISLTTVKDAFGSSMSFKSAPLVPDPIPQDPAALAEIRRRALNNPVVNADLVGEPLPHWGAIAIRFATKVTVREHEDLRSAAVGQIRGLVKQAETTGVPMQFHMTGLSMVAADFTRVVWHDTLVFTPVMLLVATAILFFFLRRTKGVLLVLGMISVTSTISLGLIPGTLSIYTGVHSLVVPIVTIMTVAFALHFLSESAKQIRTGADDPGGRETIRALLGPTSIAVITTVIGFASLQLSDVSAIRQFGRTTAAAVLATGLVVTAMFAVVWRKWPMSAFVSPQAFGTGDLLATKLVGYHAFLLRYRYLCFSAGLALLAICGYGMTKVTLGENAIGNFRKSHPVHAGALQLEAAKFGGSAPFVIAIRVNEKDRFVRPDEVHKLEALQKYLLAETPVDRVVGYVDYLKIMHRAFYAEDPAAYRLPDTEEQIAQLLLMNTDERISQYLDPDRSWVRLLARMPEHNTTKQNQIMAQIEAYLQQQFPAAAGYQTYVTGDELIYSATSYRIETTIIKSLLSSAVMILFLLILLFRSVRVGLIAMIPNFFPIVVQLGTMGLLGVQIGIGAAMISAMAIGIAIDDTAHFFEYYRRRMREHGNVEQAVRETFVFKGPAIIFSSVILALGFLVFSAAEFTALATIGVFLSLAVVAALVGDMFFMPAVILVFRLRFATKAPVRDPKLASAGAEVA